MAHARTRLIGLLIATWGMLALAADSVGAQTNYELVIPPEILRLYDPDLLSGERPRIVTITRDMIWDLREGAPPGDVYQFDFDPGDLPSVQQDIIRNFVRAGRKIFLWGWETVDDVGWRFFHGMMRWAGGESSMVEHIVNADVRHLVTQQGGRCDHWSDSDCVFFFVDYSPATEVLVSFVRGEHSGAVAGRLPYGNGSIYFSTVRGGRDYERWKLNFLQWMLGLPVPVAADTASTMAVDETTAADTVAMADRLMLKNGDTVTGEIKTDEFVIGTSYGSMTFSTTDIRSIVLEGSGQNIDTLVLRNGDKLSGVVNPTIIEIELASGELVEIDKDKIQEVLILQRPKETS